MALATGTRLGPYEIQSAIGAGGMGEVYRALDTRLDRTVAIKILADHGAGDPDLRARFEREARAIAALDHPHICVVYDVGQQDGVNFLVMQHLDGETLAARIARTHTGLPLAQALTIAIQVAQALDRAHRAGITHRDLKPANIMLTKAGAKLLDFGLAKLRGPVVPISMSSMTRLSTPGTATGTILGTTHYMAPEQVEGKDADARSDIWALGAVLYEMVTGRRPFNGDSPASVMGAILKDEPPPPSARQPLAPRALDHTVERCLIKDPEKRWQNAGDVASELEWCARGGTAPDGAAVGSRQNWRERGTWIAVFLVLAVVSSLIIWRRPTVPVGEVVRFSINPPDRVVFSRQSNMTVPTPQFAVAADGRSIAFVAAPAESRPMLWVRSLGDVTALQLAGTESAQEPFWSPDGRWIAFFAEGRLKKVPSSGGPVQTIAEPVPDTRGGDWGPDDTILFGMGASPIYRVPASGGTPVPVTRLDSGRQEGSHRWPQFLPGGRQFLFTVRSGLAEQRGVYVGSVDDQTRRLLIRGDTNAAYAGGQLLFLDGDTLLGRPFDGERIAFSGEPFTIAASIGRSSNGNGAFAASAAGTLAYAPSMMQHGRLTWYSRNGNALGTAGPDGDNDLSDFRLSPDETRLAVSLIDAKLATPDIWLTDLLRGGTSRFTFGPSLNASPVWSPDGTRIAFRTNRKGLVEFYQNGTGGGGSDEPLMLEEAARNAGLTSTTVYLTDWSPDGNNIVFSADAPADLWVLPLSARSSPVRVLRAPSDQLHGNFSPDGRFVSYSSNESGRFEVYVQTFPFSDRKWLISTSGGYEPRWRRDGREIYYLSADGNMVAVAAALGQTPSFGVPQILFRTRVHPGVFALRTHYVPSADGNRFLIHTRSADPAAALITVVLNWTATQ